MRVFGLSGSGFDVDQMVKDLMKAHRVSYDKLWQKKTQLEYKKADYYDMYTTLRDFRNSTAFNYKLESTLMPKGTSTTDESKVSATANAEAANISHTINVTQLAEGAKLTSAGSISFSDNKDSLVTQFGLDTGVFKVKINNKEITVDPNKSIYELVNSINSIDGIGIKANYDTTLDRFFVYSNESGANAKIEYSASSDTDPLIGLDFLNKTLKLADVTAISTTGLTSSSDIGVTNANDSLTTIFGVTGSFDLKLTNGTVTKDITIDSSESLNTLIDKINNAGVNAQAIYDDSDPLNRTFTLKTTSGSLSVAGSDQAAIDFLNTNLKLGINQTTPSRTGLDAQFNLDGVNLTQANNNFTISGVTYNLKSTGSATIAVSANNDKAIENVKAFIDSYNEILGKLNGELKEEKYTDYMPLTSEQKKELKESEITAWEERAKSGMLRRDSILQDAVYKLRSDISTPISGLAGDYTSLSSIGVTTGAYTEGGKLYLDETKLRKALEEDPDVLSRIFKTDSTTHSNQGIANRIYDTLKKTLDKIETAGGTSSTIDADNRSTLAKQISSYGKSLERMNDRLFNVENRYYKQFSAMEAALSRMNQQSSWLSQQLGM